MKNIYFLIITVFLSFYSIADPYIKNKHFIQLNKEINDDSQILEFFSFYCLQCFCFEKILDDLKNIFPNEIKITKYHTDYLGSLGTQLTQAWSVAMLLGIEDIISPLIFNAIHIKKSIKNINDIHEIFIKTGIDKEKYYNLWNSNLVKTLVLKQRKISVDIRLTSIPILIIKGRYIIKNESLDISSTNAYINQFSDIVKFLLMI